MNLAQKQDVIAILWDNKDSTIEEIKKTICPIIDNIGYKSSVGRCYNEKTDKNDLDTLFFSITDYTGTTSNFCEVGDYVVMDITREVMPVKCYNGKILFENYKKL